GRGLLRRLRSRDGLLRLDLFGLFRRLVCLLVGLVGHQLVPCGPRSFFTVRMRAISRLAVRSRALFSSTPVAVWKRRLKSSWRVSAILRSSSSSLSSRSSLALKEIGLSLHELRLDGELLTRKAECFLGQRLRDTRHLEHHAPGPHDGDPALGRALAGAHARLRRLLRDRLVRKEVDPHLP